MDRKAWHASVHGVAKSRTRLKQLSSSSSSSSNRQGSQGSPNGGNRLQVSDIFYLSLKLQEETNCKCQTFFSPSLYKFKEVSFKILCCHDDTWFHLNLTFLKPWANQCIFLMEMFVLSYVNVLCTYLRLRTDLTNLYVLLIHCPPDIS